MHPVLLSLSCLLLASLVWTREVRHPHACHDELSPESNALPYMHPPSMMSVAKNLFRCIPVSLSICPCTYQNQRYFFIPIKDPDQLTEDTTLYLFTRVLHFRDFTPTTFLAQSSIRSALSLQHVRPLLYITQGSAIITAVSTSTLTYASLQEASHFGPGLSLPLLLRLQPHPQAPLILSFEM
jgi:hypothetical protein